MISRIHPLPAFRDNYIWTVIDGDGGAACVVDPGDPAPVIEFLNANSLHLSDILITHHHMDHTGGLGELIGKYAPRVFGPPGIPGIGKVLAEGDRLEVFGVDFRVFEVPGHTLDHIAYFHAGSKHDTPILFCGDTLFAAGCGRLFEGTPAQMLDSLRKLMVLPPETAVHCTHEYTMANLSFAAAADPANSELQSRIRNEQGKRDIGKPTLPSTIGLELATNPFLRCGLPDLAASAGRRLGRPPTDETEVFATIRKWKDQF
ncbi:MAG: hydroxyacylglutathione hydrolase [Gammaproteobacteria bacterium]|nr:hydroxyacylglutathione hydrolase [Gammaproteobacteria bacterium]